MELRHDVRNILSNKDDSTLAKIWQYVNTAMDAMLVVLFIAFGIFIIIGVLSRVLSVPLRWSELLARVLNIWAVFFGMAIVTRKGMHIRINFLDTYIKKLGEKVYIAYSLFCYLIMFAVSCIILFGGFKVLQVSWNQSFTAMASLSMRYFYLPIAIGFGISTIYIFMNIVIIFLSLLQSKE